MTTPELKYIVEMQLWIIKFLKLIKHEKKVSIADKFLAVSYMKCANLSDTMNQESKVEECLAERLKMLWEDIKGG